MKIYANTLFSERGKLDHTRAAKRALAAYAKYVSFQHLESISLLLYTHSPTCTVVTFGNVRRNGKLCAGLKWVHIKVTMYVCWREYSWHPTRWNLIGHSTIFPPSVLLPSSILPAPSSLSAFILARKNSARGSKILFNFLKLQNRKWGKSGSVYIKPLRPLIVSMCNSVKI